MAKDYLHAPSPGQGQPLCEHYMVLLRAANSALVFMLADAERRLADEPVTQIFLDDHSCI